MLKKFNGIVNSVFTNKNPQVYFYMQVCSRIHVHIIIQYE